MKKVSSKGLRISLHLLVIVVLLALSVGNSYSGILAESVLTITASGDGFSAEIPEISTTVYGDSPADAFDLAAEAVLAYQNNLDIDNQLRALEKQIAILTLEKERLEAKKAEDEPAVYGILDAADAVRYKRALNILVEKTVWEKSIDVTKVLFRPAPEGNLYNLKLIWSWMFGTWRE